MNNRPFAAPKVSKKAYWMRQRYSYRACSKFIGILGAAFKHQVTSVLCSILDSCYWRDLYSFKMTMMWQKYWSLFIFAREPLDITGLFGTHKHQNGPFTQKVPCRLFWNLWTGIIRSYFRRITLMEPEVPMIRNFQGYSVFYRIRLVW